MSKVMITGIGMLTAVGGVLGGHKGRQAGHREDHDV